MEFSLRIYLPVFIIGFILLVFVLPSLKVYWQTGINPFRFKVNHHPAHDYIGAAMKWFIAVLLVTVFIYALFPEGYIYLVPLHYLENNFIKWTGLIAGHLSLIGIMIAQHQMKLSWRIGIDYENKTKLVTTGLFAWSRNPIFLFLLIALLGLFMVLPNAITFAVLISAYLVIQVQIRIEEEFLERQHGQPYTQYKSNTRRLL